MFDLAQGTVTQLPIPDDHGIVDVAWSGDSRFVSYLAMGDVAAGTEDRVAQLETALNTATGPSKPP